MNQHFNFVETPIRSLFRIEREPIVDSRGFFSRFFCAEAFSAIGFDKSVAQMNHTLTRKKGSVRGMHFQQPPYSETKIVTCLQGKVFDVAVDIRKKSPTYLHWYAEVLSEEGASSLYIPEGFAHGFQTLTNNCQLLYLHTTPYSPLAEGALNAFDPKLAINWPLSVTEISERDADHAMIDSQFEGVDVS